MKVKPSRDMARINRKADITDGPIVNDIHSLSGRKFQVDQISIDYILRDDIWTTHGIRIYGFALKKDGTPSKNYVERWMGDGDLAWADELVGLLRPVGATTLRFEGTSFEVTG